MRTARLAVAAGLLLAAATTATATADGPGCVDPGAPEQGFERLWDGVSDPTTSGWTQSGPGGFRVVDDGPVQGCRLLSEGGLGLLWYSAAEYSDYVLRLQWKTEDATDNSGVFVGFPADGARTHEAAIARGYEVQVREGVVGDGEDQKTGAVYNEQRELRRAARPAGQWNDYEIRVESPLRGTPVPADRQGPRITVTLNGTVVNAFSATDAGRGTGLGRLGLQNHGSNDAVSFRDLRVQQLRDDVPPVTAHEVDGEPRPDGSFAGPVRVGLSAADQRGGTGVRRTQYRLDGEEWVDLSTSERALLDSSAASFAQWKQAGPGSFARLPDGSVVGTGGLGMLWHPQEFGDAVLRMQFRDLKAGGSSNAGVFVRFPDPDATAARPAAQRLACQSGAAQTQPAWVAIFCGHEVQVYDGTSGEPQKTGSVYNFSPLGLDQARPSGTGEWSDYEVRVVGDGDYRITVRRDGELLNEFVNSPGKQSSRGGDPATDLRQFARGHFGLQNHGGTDSMQVRDVRVQSLEPAEPVVVQGAGTHILEYRSTDAAGNVEETRSVTLELAG